MINQLKTASTYEKDFQIIKYYIIFFKKKKKLNLDLPYF